MRHRPSLVLETVIDGVFRTVVLFSLFLLFAGHNAPGGGFIGGLVAAAGLLLQYVTWHLRGVDRVARASGPGVLGLGLGVAVATTMGGWLWGDTFLDGAKVEVDVGVLGTLKATTALPFDIGVYLVVVGLALSLLRVLGDEEEAS
jgi:multicomponent Na+:H+ antiporter subunit A